MRGELFTNGGTGDRQAEFDGSIDVSAMRLAVSKVGPVVGCGRPGEPPSSHRGTPLYVAAQLIAHESMSRTLGREEPLIREIRLIGEIRTIRLIRSSH